ncbi:ATP-binding cassette domain-containing protein [Kocuria sediminis]|uniref:ATP-binding cassette domain-containing protein n=1 Tax=Kocuria sediminis TaxID=1038857 RepID=A0A6N8GM26_9MICC|nr:ATP-binding cassette domain-containing protein [Kocuria sediminis]MUN63292.1 ATP-binding cassette domain-containing protein [Kocuria sediminis]
MSLQATVRLRARDLDLAVSVADGQTLAVTGPNGAGKSSLLAVVAGLLVPDTGRAALDGRVLFDLDAAGRGPWVPAHDRGVVLLAQDPLLFPHLSVLENVAFGPRSRGAGRRRARAVAGQWLEAVGAAPLAHRRPAALSGGQAQRVAVARALAADPQLLLLDEPFASLDSTAAPALRELLRRVLAGRMAVVVTHDPADVEALADAEVRLEHGRVAAAS